MLLEEKLTEAQKIIIRHICSIQLESLQRIYNNESQTEDGVNLAQLLEVHNLNEVEFEKELSLKMSYFESLHNDPNRLSQMGDDNISVITHIMTNISDRYKTKYPNAVRNIWRKLFFIRDVKMNFTAN